MKDINKNTKNKKQLDKITIILIIILCITSVWFYNVLVDNMDSVVRLLELV